MSRTVPVVTGPPREGGRPATAVCIGVFDGVHRGHRWLIGRARAAADRAGLPLTVLTFDPHPMTVVRPEAAPAALSSLTHRTRLLADAGAHEVRVLSFDRTASLLSPAEFVREYLLDDLSAELVVVGRNFRFGHRAAGDVDTLAGLGRHHEFGVEAVDLHSDPDGVVWSSSRIRELITAGDVVEARHGLDRPHRVEGDVEPGDRRGRGLGFPTANVDVPHDACRPADGVYAGWLVVDPYGRSTKRFPAAISVGANRTFDGVDPRVEAHVPDRDDLDLYGRFVAVDFLARLRDMRRYDAVADLVAAMTADVARTRDLVAAAVPDRGD